MEDLNTRVLKAFDLKPLNIVKEKGSYKIQTLDGCRIIKKTDLSADNIKFQHEVKEHLHSFGFRYIDRYYCGISEKPFVSLDGSNYIMTDYVQYPEASFENNEEFIKVIKSVANMHNILRKSKITCKQAMADEDLISCYERSINKLKKIKAGLNIEKRLSDLDVIYLKNYAYYIENIETAAKIIKTSNYNEVQRQNLNNGIRHNGLREENIYINNDDVYITNFSQATMGNFIFDLENLIRRYTKKLPENPLQISDIISIYNKNNPINKDELAVLSASLKYPQKFIKICSQYYNKKYSFIPGSIYERMQKEIKGREAYEAYLNNFDNSDWDSFL